MNHTAHPLVPAPSWGAAGALRRIVAGAHWLRIAYAEQRRAARRRAESAGLDQHAMRDLGLTRDDLLFRAADAHAIAASARQRIVDDFYLKSLR
ncbi:MAG TPA: hypothetical protein VGH48_09930 [Caldimonas sp.]|jgi:uncharacterized protein YjiS (DUF1127 family)